MTQEHDSISRQLKGTLNINVKPEKISLPNGLNYFQLVAHKIVNDEWLLGFDNDESKTFEITKKLFPLVDLLTKPKSITEFQVMKRAALEILYDEQIVRRHEPRFFFDYLLFEYGILPYDEVSFVADGRYSPDKAWETWEEITSRPFEKPEDKIIPFEQVPEVAETIREDVEMSGRFGMEVGKWRLVIHSEHLDTLNQARYALGKDGVLLVLVEGRESVKERLGDDHACSSDEERLKRIAGYPAVDYVCLVDPKLSEDEKLKEYYANIWKVIKPHYYFVGESNYRLNARFAERGMKTGTMLLWARPENRISTSDLVDEIKKSL